MTTPDPAAVLASSALRALGDAELGHIATAADVVEVAPGGVLAREGDPADAMYVVASGTVELCLHQRGADLPVATLGRGDLVGWSWLVEPTKWTFDVTSAAGATLVRLDADGLRRLAANDPTSGRALAEILLGVLSRRLRDTRIQLLDLYGETS